MRPERARRLVIETFTQPFERARFLRFTQEWLNRLDTAGDKQKVYRGAHVTQAFADKISHYERVGAYTDPEGEAIDVIVVYLKRETTLERGRTDLRNFAAQYLSKRSKAAVLAAFVSPDESDWRFSFIKLEHALEQTDEGKVRERKELTPARRYSFIVGSNEKSHTAQKQFLPLLENDTSDPTLVEIEKAFDIERVTKEFFARYKELFEKARGALDSVLKRSRPARDEFERRGIETDDFAKKLLGQIVFLYFLQKKGWFGVKRDAPWGTGDKNYLRHLFEKRETYYQRSDERTRRNFFNDILEPLFYNTLATERTNDYADRFDCKIPFLNGALFEPLFGYDWVKTDILLPDALFSNDETTPDGQDKGTGILDVFDRYNFTVNEAEPLEKDVAVDPEMLGKVFENLLPENLRHGGGAYYTPRVIVNYMCQQSLTNYLSAHLPDIRRDDIETFIRIGYAQADFEAAETQADKDKSLPDAISRSARQIDKLLEEITVCDPAIGSGAFPVGMMQEIVRARSALAKAEGLPERSAYELKRHTIQNSLYGVDIDPGAIEIAKLRLWLSLVVDEDDRDRIQALPNLDYKIMQGNSLLDEFAGVKLLDDDLLAEAFADRSAQLEIARHRRDNRRNYFLWKLHFVEVFQTRGGFDITIANPPYIDSETMVNTGMKEVRDYIAGNYQTAKGNWDIYVAFIERSFNLLNEQGSLIFITPDKWISKPFGEEVRKLYLENILSILAAGRDVFETSNVDSIITLFSKNPSTALRILATQKESISVLNNISKTIIKPPYALDFLFSSHLPLLLKIENHPRTFSDFLVCENACATSDAYKLKPFVNDYAKANPPGNVYFKVVNTGIIDKFISKWGRKPMTYLKDKYSYPVVDRKEFQRNFRDSYYEKSVKPKLLIKGLTLLDACIDASGAVIPGKSTLVITSSDIGKLKVASALINSKLFFFYISEKYSSSSYNEGITFTKDMINNIPLPSLAGAEKSLERLVDKILESKLEDSSADISALEREIDRDIYQLYELTTDEIAIIEGRT